MKNSFRILIIGLINLVCAPLGAQTFEATIDQYPFLEIPVELLIEPNDDISVTSANLDLFNNRNSSTIFIFDKNGTLKRQRTFFQRTFMPNADSSLDFLTINSGISLHNKQLFYARIRTDTPNTYSKLFFEVDSNLNIINSNIVDTTLNIETGYNRLKQFNNKVYASGSQFNYNIFTTNGLFASIDSLKDDAQNLFNQQDSVYMFDVYDFLVHPNGDVYYFGGGYIKPPIFLASDFQLLKVDSNKQFIKRDYISIPLLPSDFDQLWNRGSINAFWISDTTFVLTSNGPTSDKSDIHLFVYDTAFNQLNYRRIISIDTSEYSYLPKTGTYDNLCNCFYLGTTRKHSNFSTQLSITGETSDFRLIKFDKNLNILFNRYYRRNKTMDFHLVKTDSEGNVILVGNSQDSSKITRLNSDIFILKVDSLGNVNHPVGVKEISHEIDPINFQFYPNPSSGLVNFRQYNVLENYEMELYNSNGQLMQHYNLRNSDNSIDISNFPSGVYIYQLTDSKGRRASGKLVRE